MILYILMKMYWIFYFDDIIVIFGSLFDCLNLGMVWLILFFGSVLKMMLIIYFLILCFLGLGYMVGVEIGCRFWVDLVVRYFWIIDGKVFI